MTDDKPSRDSEQTIGHAYERLLQKALDEARRVQQRGMPKLHQIIDTVRHDVSHLGALGEEHAEKLADYLKRDLEDAARFLSETGRELKEWWGFDRVLLERQLLENFTQAADQTTVELEALQKAAEAAEYRTGEITGPGTLQCDACGEVLHFYKPGHIPPCPSCRKTHFHRQSVG